MAKHPALGWVAGVGIAAGVLWWATNRFIPVKVEGESMLPTLRPGDRLIVDRKGRVEVGKIVVVRRNDGLEIIKRVAAVDQDASLHVLGDNAAASTDSRSLGPVRPNELVGAVVARYWPSLRLIVGGNGCE